MTAHEHSELARVAVSLSFGLLAVWAWLVVDHLNRSTELPR